MKKIIIILSLLITFAAPSYTQSSLSQGIRLYKSGNYDEALNFFGSAVEKNPRCPLAYYYAARIRINREQFSRARQNLEAALRDSLDFSDARASLAYTMRKMGINKEALENWKMFLHSFDGADISEWADVDKIMLPEIFAGELALERKTAQTEIRKTSSKAREKSDSLMASSLRDSALSATGAVIAVKDTSTITDSALEGGDDSLALSAAEDTLAGAPIADIEQRIRNGIRTGIYGISATIIIMILGGFSYWFIRRRRRNKSEDLNFNEQVARIIDDRDFELGEEQAIKEFEAKKQELARELRGLTGMKTPSVPEAYLRTDYEDRGRVIYEESGETEEEYLPGSNNETEIEDDSPDDPMKPAWSQNSGVKSRTSTPNGGKPPITEEIKALVSRLYREGHSPDDIARTSDLTKSEVNLILAVREHHMDSLIRDIAEEESRPDRDSLVHAVSDLLDEGADIREIARRLKISTSEVRLVSMMIGRRKF